MCLIDKNDIELRRERNLIDFWRYHQDVVPMNSELELLLTPNEVYLCRMKFDNASRLELGQVAIV